MEKEKPEECHSCDYLTEDLDIYDRGPGADSEEPMWLCALCASTRAGNAYQYPRQYPNEDVLRTICYVGNVILDQLKEQQ